jgi:hypothetical protein
MPGFVGLDPLVAAFCAGPKISPHPRPVITPDFPVTGQVARLSGSSRAGIPGGYGSVPQNFAGLE